MRVSKYIYTCNYVLYILLHSISHLLPLFCCVGQNMVLELNGRKRNETAPSCAKTAQHGATFWRKAGDIPELLDHQRRAAA